jgi:hypothetical protein
MRLIDGIKLRGRPAQIPDCSRDDLPEFFKEMGYKVGVEIGVYKGAFTEQFCRAGLRMYAVDPWLAYSDYEVTYVTKPVNFQDRQDFLYEHTKRVLAPYDCTIIRETSMCAVQLIANESIDFVYIDGHHGFKYVAEDIWEWSKKVRKGGVISGHDYGTNHRPPLDPYTLHVKHVVDAYTSACGIKNWYVLGKYETLEGEKRDRWRSWMWIK